MSGGKLTLRWEKKRVKKEKKERSADSDRQSERPDEQGWHTKNLPGEESMSSWRREKK